MADAAFEILKQRSQRIVLEISLSTKLYLRDSGQTDFEKYRLSTNELIRDFFVPDDIANNLPTKTVSVY